MAPAAQAVRLGPGANDLGVDVADGRRLARCLRCDAWLRVPVPSPGEARWDQLPAVGELPRPRRGKVLHDAILLRVVAIDRAVHCVTFGLVALAVGVLMLELGAVHQFATSLIRNLNHSIGEATQGPGGSWLDRELPKLADLQPRALRTVFAISVGYSLVEGAEAVGLWLEKRWAEYLTVLATAGFLPLEIHELTKRVTVLRIMTLLVNLAILVWLVWSKRLFGLRGGTAALQQTTDWKAVLATDDSAPANLEHAPRRPRLAPLAAEDEHGRRDERDHPPR